MKIRSIDNSIRFQGTDRLAKKVFQGTLKDDSKAIVELRFDSQTNIKMFEVYQVLKGKVIGGFGMKNVKGIAPIEIANLFLKLQKNAKEGVDFMDEFSKAPISYIS